MGFLAKIALDVFGNKASLIFAGIVVAALSTMAYNWKQNYDEKIAERVENKYTAAELAREREARKIYQDAVSKSMDNKLKDEKAIARLETYSKTQQALINETINQLNQTGGDWANVKPPSNRQRVLAASLKRLEASRNADISADSTRTSSRRAVDGLRGDILREFNRAADAR